MSCEIETTQRFRRSIPEGHHAAVVDTLNALREGFGKPHIHSGLSIRKLARRLYECRTGLDLRLVFEARKGTLTFDFAGSHDEVWAYLKGRR
jgi:mRNA-degrading endonuclease YafQ of YafQ-DinJ toxin-antitoxin module